MPPGLGEILAESGDLTLRRLKRASDWRRAHGGTIDRALLATGAVGEITRKALVTELIPTISKVYDGFVRFVPVNGESQVDYQISFSLFGEIIPVQSGSISDS